MCRCCLVHWDWNKVNRDLNADDIDVLIPEIFLNEKWDNIIELMSNAGYTAICASMNLKNLTCALLLPLSRVWRRLRV